MARAGSGQQNQDSKSQQKPAPRKASRRSTQKSTRASTQKQVKREEAAANPLAAFDRSQLAEKTRVFQLAKALGVPSKELIVALSELGVVKVAQSSLTRAESEQLLDVLSTRGGAEDQPRSSADVDAADERIRNRIRKDVANEINQIERKVEAELSDRADGGADSAEVAADAERPEDAEGAQGQGTTDAAHEADDTDAAAGDVEVAEDAEDTDDTSGGVHARGGQLQQRGLARPGRAADQDGGAVAHERLEGVGPEGAVRPAVGQRGQRRRRRGRGRGCRARRGSRPPCPRG